MEGVAEGGSSAREGLDDTGAIGLVKVVDAEVGVRGVTAEDGFGGAELGAFAAEEGAEGGLAAMEVHGGDAEGGSGAADGWTSAAFEDLAEPRSGIHSS